MPSLPPEMWLEILQYIPLQSTYPKLLAVNSVVFHMLMDRKWRSVSIVTSIHSLSMRVAHRLQDPAVAARVHSINLDISLSSKSIDDILILFSSCMVHLVNLTEFSSNISTQGAVGPLNPHLRSLFRDMWTSFGPKLRSLSLTAAVPRYEYFGLDSPTFSGLDRLHLTSYYGSSAGPVNSLQDALLPTGILSCLSSARNRLESLGITLLGPITDSPEFLTQTPRFLRLKSLSLVVPPNATVPSICYLLQHCLAALHTLDLDFGHFSLGDIDLTEISNCLQNSQVQTLIVRPQYSSVDSLREADALGKVVRAVQKSVTCVIARTDAWLKTEDFLPLFEALASCHSLKHLDIQISSLNTSILGKLAKSLPHLDSLAIVHRMHYRSPQYEITFDALMAEDYSAWHLKSLSLYRNTRTTPDKRLALAIQRSAPSIQKILSRNI